MSGGVDSSVAAALLQQQGHEVTGVTLQLRPCTEQMDSRSCCGSGGLDSAREVAAQLGLPHYALPCHQQFDDLILRPAWAAYASGRTPSPCLLCNELIKFGFLLSWARRLGAQAVATGHYARINRGPTGHPTLLRAGDGAKDQAYFLARLTPRILDQILFPLGDLTKPEVRALARSLGLPAADRTDSQDACLVEDGIHFPEMLRRRYGGCSVPGNLVDDQGRIIATHQGLHNFTVGQRHGLGVALGKPAWVRAISPDGTVEVTTDPEALVRRELTVSGLVWMDETLPDNLSCEVQVRFRHRPAQALVTSTGPGTAKVQIPGGASAVAPGQAAAFFDGDRVLGSGWID
jgi:tRNA-specific 2-thiouridylase